MQLNTQGLLLGLKINLKTTIMIQRSAKRKKIRIWKKIEKREDLGNKEIRKVEYLKDLKRISNISKSQKKSLMRINKQR